MSAPDSDDDVTDLLQRAHAIAQAYLWHLARSAARAPDLSSARDLSLDRVRAERRARVIRARLAGASCGPSTRRDVIEVLRGMPDRLGEMREKELSAYRALQRAAEKGGYADLAGIARLLHDEAAGASSPWSARDAA